jgi:hypothetical protein
MAATSSENTDSTCLSLENHSKDHVPLNSYQIFAKERIKGELMLVLKENASEYLLFDHAWVSRKTLGTPKSSTTDGSILEC